MTDFDEDASVGCNFFAVFRCMLSRLKDFDGAWWNFVPKVIADQTVWSVFLNAAYSTMIMSLQGLSPENVSSCAEHAGRKINSTTFSAPPSLLIRQDILARVVVAHLPPTYALLQATNRDVMCAFLERICLKC